MSNNDRDSIDASCKSPDMPKFADELPEHCPPHDALPASGTFYVAHQAFPANENDFRTAAERGVFKQADECLRRGNSIMASPEDARQLCRAYPGVYVFVSKGVLVSAHGLLKERGTRQYPSHHTLWRFTGVTMYKIFVELI